MEITMRRPKIKEVIELTDGSQREITLHNLSMAETDEYFEIYGRFEKKVEAKVREEAAKDREKVGMAGQMKKFAVDYYNILISESQELWQIMTRSADASWILDADDQTLLDLEKKFEEINPRIKFAKKNLNIAGILMNHCVQNLQKILSGDLDYGEFLCSLQILLKETL